MHVLIEQEMPEYVYALMIEWKPVVVAAATAKNVGRKRTEKVRLHSLNESTAASIAQRTHKTTFTREIELKNKP